MKPLITAFFAFMYLSLSAQIAVYDGNSFTIDEIDDETVDQLIETVTKAIQNYDSWATMLDVERDAVTSQSLKNFKSLFERNAKIVDDLSMESDKVHYADYAGKVLEFLEGEGVRFNMYGALIDQIGYDSTGYYEVDVITEKYLYNGLEGNNKRFYCRNGRIFRLKFTFSIPEDELDVAKILQIKGQLARDCEDKVPVFHVAVQTGTSFFKNTKNDFYKTNFPNLDWETAPQLHFGIDLDLQYPLDKKDHWFFLLGANYRRYRLINEFSGVYNIPLFTTNGDIKGERFIQFTKLEEKIKTHVLEIPIGLRLNILNRDPLYIFVDASVGINIPIQSSGYFESNIVYAQTVDGMTTTISVDSTGAISPEPLNYDLDPKLKINYAAQLGPTFQYILGQSFAFQIDFKYQYGLSSWFNHQEESESENFRIGESLNSKWLGGLSEVYATKTRLHSFGIHLGVIYKQRW